MLLFREHLAEYCQYGLLGFGADPSELFNEPRFVHRSHLIEHNLPILSLKLAGHSRRIWVLLGSHWGDNECRNKSIHLIR